MKIEKINDHQIRCTLTSDDLANREIKLSELAYGTEKAKTLFHDMMQQAQFEFGFEADNLPLMIEVIPVTPDSIVLIITKVEDPEELDTRFSKFSPSGEEDARENASPFTGADDILDIFQKLVDSKLKVQGSAKKDEEKEKAAETPAVNLLQLFRFSSLDGAIRAARGLTLPYDGENSLYKDPRDNSYCLALHQSGCSPEEFNRICNVLSEYGQGKTCTAAREAYLKEHGELLIKNSALHLLAQL